MAICNKMQGSTAKVPLNILQVSQYLWAVDVAIERWLKKDDKYNPSDYRAFAKFMGFEEGLNWIVDVENPDVRDLLEKIVGPHGNTVLKMLDIRNKDELP